MKFCGDEMIRIRMFAQASTTAFILFAWSLSSGGLLKQTLRCALAIRQGGSKIQGRNSPQRPLKHPWR